MEPCIQGVPLGFDAQLTRRMMCVMPAVMDPRELDSAVCSIARTMELIGHPWTLLVLRDLFNGVRRFDELADHLGIARNVLTRRLAGLVDAGWSRRCPTRTGQRARHEYRLTRAGWTCGRCCWP